MHALIFVLIAIYTVVAVAVRRLFMGPLHPGWSYRYETLAEILRKANTRHLSLPVAQMRKMLLDARIHPRISKNVVHARTTLAGLRAETFTPRGWTETDATLLYLHGGGYVVCSPATHRDLISRIAHATRARTVAVD